MSCKAILLRLLTKLQPIQQFIRDFLLSSTIHGFNHIAASKRHFIERLIWVSLVAMGLYATGILSGLTLTRYFENPTVISMERDRFSWNTSFPAATICPSTKLEETKFNVLSHNNDICVAKLSNFQEYIDNSNATNKTALREFIISLANAGYDNFETVLHYPDINPNDYMDLLLKLRFGFKPQLSNSGVSGRHYTLQTSITEFGVCYSFNSQLAVYNSPEFWKSNQWKLVPQNDTFYVNPLDGEVFANVVNMSTGYKLFIHGPYEVADVSSKALDSPNGYFLQVYLTALSIYSSERARALQVNQRKCRFYYESDLRHSPVYSYVLCRTECRLQLALRLCSCVPHFYRRLDGYKVCDVQGMHCLARHKDRLVAMKKECKCLTNCDEVNYVVQHYDAREWFLGSNLQWGLKEYPRMRLKRDVIFGFADVLVYVGGMAGLFFGCSVLSFAEIFYFFTLHLYFFVMKSRRGQTKQPLTNSDLKAIEATRQNHNGHKNEAVWTNPPEGFQHYNMINFRKLRGQNRHVYIRPKK